MAHLALSLLGPFRATLDGRPAEGLSSARLRALLAYLAVGNGRSYPREQLAALLWPERPDREALGALRYALSNLRGALGDRQAPSPFLNVTRATAQFSPTSDHWLDAAEFERLRSGSTVEDLERAASLYRGAFLEGLSVDDSPCLDEWILLTGEEFRRSVLSILGRLTALHLERGAYAEAIHWARRQLEREPYREQGHRQLMTALALSGERAAALAHYEACRRLLAAELSCEPDDETQALRARIQSGALSRPPSYPAVLSAPSTQTPPSGATRPRSHFVAREEELARLDALLDRTIAGNGGVALIVGEAGSGKTALLDEFARRAGQTHPDLIALCGGCNAHAGAGDPYLPFREVLQTLAGDVEGKRAGGTISREQARRVWELVPVMGAMLVKHGPDLIGTFVPGEALLQRLDAFPSPRGGGRWLTRLREIVRRPQEREGQASEAGVPAPAPQQDLFAQATRVLHAVSLEQPLVLGIDDLQWADGGTVALLFHLGRRLSGSRILLACACRPQVLDIGETANVAPGIGAVIREICRPWGDALLDLDRADGRAFVEAYVDREPNRLGAGFRQALYDHTDGNPLFTVELLHGFERTGALVQDEAGCWVEAHRLNWDQWPPQVEAVIAAQMAALPPEDWALLQAASVQGEQFSAEIVARVIGNSEGAIVRRLSGPLRTRDRLVSAVSLDRLASSGKRLSHYRFRHSLVHRSVYHSLDPVERARLHEATGRSLEAIYTGAGADSVVLAPELARHFEEASMPLEASRYRLAAGRWAARLAAYDEALVHLERGLALLDEVAPSRERLHLELALSLAMANPAMLGRGWRAPTLAQAQERIRRLCQHPDLQDNPQRLTALGVLAHASTWSADPASGQRVGEQLMELARDGDRQSLMLAHWVLGHAYWLQGSFVAAREHLDEALAIYDANIHRRLSPLMGASPDQMGQSLLGLVLWLLGYPDQGRNCLWQAAAQEEGGEPPSSGAFVYLVAGIAHSILGVDATVVRDIAQFLRSQGRMSPIYGAWAEIFAAHAQVMAEASGPSDSNRALEPLLARATEAGGALQAAGSGMGHAAQWLIRAQMSVRARRPEMGLAATEEALAWIERTGVRATEAEVWRMRGELLLLADGPDESTGAEAEACFRRAVEVAREQRARFLELRAAISLAQLWRGRGLRDEARALLADIYGWFAEGFDTPDLQAARAMLEQ